MHDLAKRITEAKGTALFSTGQAGFVLKSNSGQLLAIDLYLSNCVERLEGHMGFKRLLPQLLSPTEFIFDVIICTHPHWDHFDVDALPKMIKNGSKLFCSIECEKLVKEYEMDCYSEQITYVKPGDRATVGDIELRFVDCDHGLGAPDAVGVIVRVDGKTIYEVGDSCLRLDWVESIPQPLDVLISPINGMYGNMDSDETATLAESLKPKLTVPCHYGMFASHGGNLKRFYEIMTEKKLPFLIMQQGEGFAL